MVLKDIYYYFLIKRSGMFDKNYYLLKNPDVRNADIDPLWHFVKFGWREGRNPSEFFNGNEYLDLYYDVRAANINPLIHYIKFGASENRLPKKLQSDHERSSKIFLEDISIEKRRHQLFKIVPYFLDPFFDVTKQATIDSSANIAVHLHVFNNTKLNEMLQLLNNFPCNIDLFVSSSIDLRQEEIRVYINNKVKSVNTVFFSTKILFQNDLVPLFTCFGQHLLGYDYVCHIHNQYPPSESTTTSNFQQNLFEIIGSKQTISQIIELLQKDAKFVYPSPNEFQHDYLNNGWADYFKISKILLYNLLNKSIEDYPENEFPQDSIFWARTSSLQGFFHINEEEYITYQHEFSQDEFDNALKRLLLIPSLDHTGRNYRIQSTISFEKSPYYECQRDYSENTSKSNVKVLTYYLPQFYPIPENDMWHGEGFTEWHKVKSANPLFYGHYQQRAPHEEIGYYTLADVETLKKQTSLMKKCGVYGQVFYHYWFDGKLILEKPAQLLLKDKSIDMPFCFCWANENWTRKWDGNEDDVILKQNYSAQDAKEFIDYLLPFFKDDRYIKIDDRPVIYIYRPSLFPDFSIYKNCWKAVCEANQIPEPFIIAVMTRGVSTPAAYGMDAGIERVLHDWAEGQIHPINHLLHKYWPVHRNVLNYEEVAEYYANKKRDTDYLYFRSLVPSWDNTPRYGSEAHIVHNSDPEQFQNWLNALIYDAEERLPEKCQLVVINAWNEWAESAYLEPDQRFGYAYLNSIGRALSGIEFNHREYLEQTIPKHINLSINFAENLINRLQFDKKARRKLMMCLRKSTIFGLCNVSINQDQVIKWLAEESGLNITDQMTPNENEPDYTLHINNLCYFPSDTIENLLRMSLRYDVGTVSPTHVNDEAFIHEDLLPRWAAFRNSPYLFLSKKENDNSKKCCVDAQIFISDYSDLQEIEHKVTTIVRFSEKDRLGLLRKALYSLVAQVGCIVQPLIALNNVPEEILVELKNLLNEIPWDEGCYPIIRIYNSDKQEDLRSKMLNDSLRHVDTQFAAFLDYDDTLFHDAYQWLIRRLIKTKKKASFGSIYHLIYRLVEERMTQRQILGYGRSYQSFLEDNNTPIHGFMLNLENIDRERIKYYDNMKYMEDYYLTLQIFDLKNTDWESKESDKFIGDYVHFVDKHQTLGILNTQIREKLLTDPEYQKCQDRIDELKNAIMKNVLQSNKTTWFTQ